MRRVRICYYLAYWKQRREADCRQVVSEMDRVLADWVSFFASLGKRVLVVGGGHNNALPVMEGMCRGRSMGSISVFNIDAHADMRVPVERHSGNAFSFAWKRKILHRYVLLGFHEAYMPAYIMDTYEKHSERFFAKSYEQICVDNFKEEGMQRALEEGVAFLEGENVQLEIDIDSLAYADSSARSPEGWSLRETRRYLRYITRRLQPLALHLCEGRAEEEPDYLVGKRLGYLIFDFLSCMR